MLEVRCRDHPCPLNVEPHESRVRLEVVDRRQSLPELLNVQLKVGQSLEELPDEVLSFNAQHILFILE